MKYGISKRKWLLLWYLPLCILGFNKITIFKSHYEDLKISLVKSKKKKKKLGLKVRNMTRKITLTKSITRPLESSLKLFRYFVFYL